MLFDIWGNLLLLSSVNGSSGCYYDGYYFCMYMVWAGQETHLGMQKCGQKDFLDHRELVSLLWSQ